MRNFLTAGLIGLMLGATGCSDTEATGSTAAALSSNNSGKATSPAVQDRFMVFESELDHSSTLGSLLTALDRRDLNVFAVIDHAAGAQAAGLELHQSTLVVFGSPKTGTPLMQADPLIGAELPLRALVYERGDRTFVAMSGMAFLERTYQLSAREELIDKITDTLNAIANEATKA